MVEAFGDVGYQAENGGQLIIPLENVEGYAVEFLRTALALSVERLAGGWPLTIRTAMVGHSEAVGRTSNRELASHFDEMPLLKALIRSSASRRLSGEYAGERPCLDATGF